MINIENYTKGKNIKRAGGGIMHVAGWVMIFAYTGTCTILLMRQYAPPSAPWLPWAGLAAFEYGVIHWLHYHRHNAKNAYQFVVGLVMTIISALAIALCTGSEMLSWFGMQLPDWIQGAIFYAITGVVVANVVAFILCSLFDPEHFLTWKRHNAAESYEDARDVQVQMVYAQTGSIPVVPSLPERQAPAQLPAPQQAPLALPEAPGLIGRFLDALRNFDKAQEPAPAAHVARGGGRYVPPTPAPAAPVPTRKVARPESTEAQRKARRDREAKYHIKPTRQEQPPDPQPARMTQERSQQTSPTTGTRKKPKKDLPPMRS